MIRFIYGPGGSGKTKRISELISADLAAGKRAYLLVPEQQAVITERQMADILPPCAPLYFEVLNFSRLANSVFRKYGGLSYKYANKGTKSLLMWRALSELSPFLQEYKSSGTDCPSTPVMLAAYNELRAYAASPEQLGRISDKLPKDSSVRRKFGDISLACSFYEALLREKYADAADDLDKLAQMLETHDFFCGTNVYVDSFSSFTQQEYNILEQIFAKAENTTAAFLCDAPNGNQMHFSEVYDTCARLKSITARQGQTVAEEILPGNIRCGSAALIFAQKHLWKLDISKESVYTGEIEDAFCDGKVLDKAARIIECPDPFTEAEAVASDMLRRIQSGARYRHFAVIMRSSADYEGIIDAVFEKYRIPFFMSVSSDLESKPLIKLIYTALSICTGGWKQSDVISYIKTGLCGLTPEESDIFEFYTSVWRINGTLYTDGTEWNMNPDGYTSTLSERGADILSRVNDIRARLVRPLVKFFGSFNADATFESASRALIEFLSDIEVPSALSAAAKAAYADGDFARSSELVRLWNILSDSLDTAVEAIGSLNVTVATYQKLLRLMLSEVDISNIPTTADEVIIGSADLLRLGEVRHVYIIGAVEGKFPASLSDNGIFTDSDKRLLSDYGITLSADLAMRSSRELFFFYRSLCCASDSVTLTYPSAELSGSAQKPSFALNRIRFLLPDLKTINFDNIPLSDRLYEKETAFEYIPMLDGLPEGNALRRIYGADAYGQLKLSLTQLPLSQNKCVVSPQLANELFGDKISFTQSRLDSYVQCHFSYFCKYILQLKEHRSAEFDRGDIGNFIHYILERLVRELAHNNDTPLETLTDETIREYIKEVCPPGSKDSARLTHLFTRLRRTVMLIAEDLEGEFEQSSFTPKYFELHIDDDNENAPEPLCFELSNNAKVMLYGVVDRVDTYKKGDDVYLRVVDYKTGVKDFSMADVKQGLHLQLLLYLFTLWKNGSEGFARSLGVGDGGSILPAGLLYYSAKPPEITMPNYTRDVESVKAKAAAELKRKGILLSDPDILRAMDSSLSGHYIPAKLNKNDTLGGSAVFMSADGMSGLYEEVRDIIVNISEHLCGGDASAVPVAGSDKKIPCDFCAMKPVCRVEAKSSQDDEE